MTTDLFILFIDNEGKRKSDPLSLFYPSHLCAIENTEPLSLFFLSLKLSIRLLIRIRYML